MSADNASVQRALAVALERARIAEARVDELRARADRYAATASLGVMTLQRLADAAPVDEWRAELLSMVRHMREGIAS